VLLDELSRQFLDLALHRFFGKAVILEFHRM
jgi:hypothetical protein